LLVVVEAVRNSYEHYPYSPAVDDRENIDSSGRTVEDVARFIIYFDPTKLIWKINQSLLPDGEPLRRQSIRCGGLRLKFRYRCQCNEGAMYPGTQKKYNLNNLQIHQLAIKRVKDSRTRTKPDWMKKLRFELSDLSLREAAGEANREIERRWRTTEDLVFSHDQHAQFL
jgi:hypothetical protein